MCLLIFAFLVNTYGRILDMRVFLREIYCIVVLERPESKDQKDPQIQKRMV